MEKMNPDRDYRYRILLGEMPSAAVLEFKRDVQREIPPVVFFHDLEKERVASEVEEYIVTGGWPADHPNANRVSNGIHEQYVKLLRNLRSST